MSDQMQAWLEVHLGLPPHVQERLAITLAAVMLLTAGRWLLLRLVYRRVTSVKARYTWKRSSSYAVFFIAMLVMLRVWVGATPLLTTYFGLLSAGLAIALQSPLLNLAGWLFILWRRPFRVGDRIEIGDARGDVIDSRLFQFTLLEIGNWVDADQSTGRIIHVPNAKVFKDSLANYTSGFQFIWNELPVTVTFESNWRKAKELLSEIAVNNSQHLSEQAARRVRKASERYMIFFRKLDPIVYTSVADSGVTLTIRYLCPPRQRRGTAQVLWEAILDAFAAHDDIDLAYPTQRFYNNTVEGKEGARADPRTRPRGLGD